MGVSNYDDSDDQQPKRLIYEMREYVQQVRNLVWDAGIDGELSVSNKRRLAKAAIKYWDVLYEFRDESVLSDGDFPDIEPVRQRVGRKTEVPVASSRRGGGESMKQVPAVDDLDDWYLIELTEDLDDLAKKLGFGASASDRPETSKFDESDLVTLISARGQEDALEEAPDDITQRVIDTLEEHNGD